jgi:hypothetical protein
MSLSFAVLSMLLALQAPSGDGGLQTQMPGRTGPSSPASVDGSAWTLVDMPDHVLDGDRIPTLAFAGGRVQGSDGCNRYTAAYTSGEGGAFRLSGQLAGTRMAASAPPRSARRCAALAASASTATGSRSSMARASRSSHSSRSYSN